MKLVVLLLVAGSVRTYKWGRRQRDQRDDRGRLAGMYGHAQIENRLWGNLGRDEDLVTGGCGGKIRAYQRARDHDERGFFPSFRVQLHLEVLIAKISSIFLSL
jgi:hypothetical protein